MTQLSVVCAVRVTLCVSGIVRAVHQSSSKLGDPPLARLDLFESLPSRGFAVEPLQQTLQQNPALHRSTTHAVRPAPDVELYSSTALQSALQLYSSTALYTLHPLHPPSECHCHTRASARAPCSRTATPPESRLDSHSPPVARWPVRRTRVPKR